MMTEGAPSIRNSQRQPSSPWTPLSASMMAPDRGLPITPAIATAETNHARRTARMGEGYQSVR